jgi:thioredoxin 1
MAPVIERIEQEFDVQIKFGTLNVDQNPRTASEYHIKGVPAFIIFNSGLVLDRKVAAQSDRQLRQMIEIALNGRTADPL